MSIEKVAEAVCSMAKDHKQKGYSMAELIEESGYRTIFNEVTEQTIESFLRTQPDLIDSWLIYSMDQRSTPSWYIKSPVDFPEKEILWIVGFLPRNVGNSKEVHEFKDGFQACAFFIKKISYQIIS